MVESPDHELIASLRHMYDEHCTQGRHHETQRSLVMSATTALSSAICGLILVDTKITPSDFALAIIMVAVGLFGALFSMKHYERFRRHMEMARGFRDAFDKLLACELSPEPVAAIRKAAEERHRNSFPKLSRLRLNHLWVVLHGFLAVLGGVLAVVAL